MPFGALWEKIAEETDPDWRNDERIRADIPVRLDRLGPESFLPPALDTEIIKVANAKSDLEDRGE